MEGGKQLSTDQETGRGTDARRKKSELALGAMDQETGSSRQAGAGVLTSSE